MRPGMFTDGSLTLFRVRGVPIRAHWTLLLVVPYLAIGLARQFGAIADLAGVDDVRSLMPPFVWGLLLAVLLFASIAVHELGHTFVATRFGGRVRSITLMLIGGVSELAQAPKRPLHEALMAIAGPATSFAIAITCILLYGTLTTPSADLQMTLFYLAAMNMSLGLFNLIPAFPMDGGRVLRAALSAWLGPQRATAIAARVGQACAIAFAVLAIATANWSLGLVALFVYASAGGEARSERAKKIVTGLAVSDLLPADQPRPVILFDATVDDMLQRMRELDRVELIVIDRYGRPSAVLDADDASSVIASGRGDLTVGALAASLGFRHVVVATNLSAAEALDAAAAEGATYLVVVDPPSGEVIGLVGPQDIARALRLHVNQPRPLAARPMAS